MGEEGFHRRVLPKLLFFFLFLLFCCFWFFLERSYFNYGNKKRLLLNDIYIYIFQEKIYVSGISEKQLWLLFLNGGEGGFI